MTNIISAALLFLCLSPLRNLLIPLSPLCLFLSKRFTLKELLGLIVVFIYVITMILVKGGELYINQLLSFLLLYPIIVFLVCYRSLIDYIISRNGKKFLQGICYVLFLNGLLGLVQYAINPYDDAAIGFYGRSGLQTHGLAILYTFSAAYLLSNSKSLARTFFGISFIPLIVLCFYGAGLLSVAIALIVVAFVSTNNRLRATFKITFGCLLAILLGFILSPRTMIYNYSVISTFIEAGYQVLGGGAFSDIGIPRKLVAWLNYFDMVSESPKNVIWGVGGGGFNSRAAFLLNGEYSSNSLLPITPSIWHEIYIHPLWSDLILSKDYQDGTMNQPFSSALAILSEYGLIGVLFFSLCFYQMRLFLVNRFSGCHRSNRFLIDFLLVYFVLQCFIDNILEYPEIIIPFVFFLSGAVAQSAGSPNEGRVL